MSGEKGCFSAGFFESLLVTFGILILRGVKGALICICLLLCITDNLYYVILHTVVTLCRIH